MNKQVSKVLIVDDSPFFRVSMANFLKNHYAFEVEEINSAKELLAYAKTDDMRQVFLIILDLYLADGNGLDAMKQIAEEPENNNAPFILVSARIDKDTVAKAFREGARDIVAKPINYTQLKERLDNLIDPEHRAKTKRDIMDYNEQIGIEIKRAKRGNYELSIVLAGLFLKVDYKSLYKDVSHKNIIDLEQQYPQELQKAMRETDIIISLSPSDYLFILPFTNKTGIAFVREKITSVLSNMIAEKEKNNLLVVIEAATFPEDGETPKQLIARIESDLKNELTNKNL